MSNSLVKSSLVLGPHIAHFHGPRDEKVVDGQRVAHSRRITRITQLKEDCGPGWRLPPTSDPILRQPEIIENIRPHPDLKGCAHLSQCLRFKSHCFLLSSLQVDLRRHNT
uniref:Uncharacterized protein n=1 Tax=Cacopsylla melanoneura TaxID=428564 RepID=A0A8D8TMM3_9HEMI